MDCYSEELSDGWIKGIQELDYGLEGIRGAIIHYRQLLLVTTRGDRRSQKKNLGQSNPWTTPPLRSKIRAQEAQSKTGNSKNSLILRNDPNLLGLLKPLNLHANVHHPMVPLSTTPTHEHDRSPRNTKLRDLS